MGLERRKEIAILLNEELCEMFKEAGQEISPAILKAKINKIKNDSDSDRVASDIVRTAVVLNDLMTIKDSPELEVKKKRSKKKAK